MPSSSGVFIGAKHLLGRRMGCAAWEWVATSSGLAAEQYFPRLLVFDKKKVRMKFKENIVVRGNAMN
jgi:hypothetical protein